MEDFLLQPTPSVLLSPHAYWMLANSEPHLTHSGIIDFENSGINNFMVAYLMTNPLHLTGVFFSVFLYESAHIPDGARILMNNVNNLAHTQIMRQPYLWQFDLIIICVWGEPIHRLVSLGQEMHSKKSSVCDSWFWSLEDCALCNGSNQMLSYWSLSFSTR